MGISLQGMLVAEVLLFAAQPLEVLRELPQLVLRPVFLVPWRPQGPKALCPDFGLVVQFDVAAALRRHVAR